MIDGECPDSLLAPSPAIDVERIAFALGHDLQPRYALSSLNPPGARHDYGR
jgi:hypothetical protein